MYVKSFDMKNRFREVPIINAAVFFLIWLIGTDLLLLLIDKVLVFPLALMMGFGFIYPVGASVLFFMLSKRHGVLWYFPVAVLAATALHMLFWASYRAVIPNMFVMTALCLLFSCGIGGCFADKESIKAYREKQKLKRLGEDKQYTPILEAKKKNKDPGSEIK